MSLQCIAGGAAIYRYPSLLILLWMVWVRTHNALILEAHAALLGTPTAQSARYHVFHNLNTPPLLKTSIAVLLLLQLMTILLSQLTSEDEAGKSAKEKKSWFSKVRTCM